MPAVASKEPSAASQDKVQPLPLGQITATELANTFALAMRRFKLRQPDQVKVTLTGRPIQELTAFLDGQLAKRKQLSFFELTAKVQGLPDLVGLFLAVLQEIKDQRLRVKQARAFGDLELERIDADDK